MCLLSAIVKSALINNMCMLNKKLTTVPHLGIVMQVVSCRQCAVIWCFFSRKKDQGELRDEKLLVSFYKENGSTVPGKCYNKRWEQKTRIFSNIKIHTYRNRKQSQIFLNALNKDSIDTISWFPIPPNRNVYTSLFQLIRVKVDQYLCMSLDIVKTPN